MTKRRDFLQQSAALLADSALPPFRRGPDPFSAGWYHRPMRWAQLTLVEDDPGNYDPQFWLDYFRRTHSDAACLSAGGCVTYPTKVPLDYPSRFLGDRDSFCELVARCRKLGMNVVARADAHAVHQDVYGAQPDWIAVDGAGSKRKHWADPVLWGACALGPYNFEFLTDVTREIISSPPQQVRAHLPQGRRARSGAMWKRWFLVSTLTIGCAVAQEGWWMKEPVRWVQTNLRQTDANLDAKRLVEQLSDMGANVLLQGMGGIAAYYPTTTEFHYPSPQLPPGHDMFGDTLREAHARKIRVVGRFDFSKTRKAVFDAHPEWFFRQANGQPVIYNGLYSTCINGGYYREQAMKILTEALDKYAVDGLFFNMFGNQSRDYSGRAVGLCHCDVCRRLYREKFHKDIPDAPDDDYRRFMFVSSREVAAAIGDLIRKKRPEAGYFNYIHESTDGIMSESNTALTRTLAWPYSASDQVNRASNSQPGKMSVNLNMQFVDYAWRFATVPREEIALRCWQNMANGGALTFEVNGTLDQQDRQALETAKPIFRWAAANQEYYVGQTSAARVLLLVAPADAGRSYSEEPYRGLFRLLSEEHIPFAVSENMDWFGKRDYDLVIASDWAPAGLRRYAVNGGKVLVVSASKPEFEVVPVVRTQSDIKGYVRVRDHSAFPSLKDVDLLMLNGPFTELTAAGPNSLTLVPPSMIGPPEFVHIDIKDTDTPAIAIRPMGKGTVAWIPWNLGSLYYLHSLPAHAGLFRDVVAGLLVRPQVRTNAHRLVEMTVMRQGSRTLVHLINLSGQSQTGYFAPVPMSGIQMRVLGNFKAAKTVRSPGEIAVGTSQGYSEFTVPRLTDYELVVLENDR